MRALEASAAQETGRYVGRLLARVGRVRRELGCTIEDAAELMLREELRVKRARLRVITRLLARRRGRAR